MEENIIKDIFELLDNIAINNLLEDNMDPNVEFSIIIYLSIKNRWEK